MPELVPAEGIRLLVGDVRAVLRELPDESVDCVVTSPPYWGLRDYGTGEWEGGDVECDHRHDTAHQKQGATSQRGGRTNVNEQRNENFRDVCGKCGATRIDRQLGLEPTPEEYVSNMVEVFREVRRVLAKHGTCWLNLGDSFMPGKQMAGVPWRVAFALQADGWYLRADIIWSKPNPMPESVTDRPTKAHEYVFLLTKQARYFFDQEAVREPHNPNTFKYNPRYGTPDDVKITKDNAETVNSRGYQTPENPGGWGERWLNPAGRNIRSVWEIPTQPYPEAHFATYPEALVERCIKAGSPKGGVVLDPFAGSGTTPVVARQLGRNAIGIELNPAYAQLAVRRCARWWAKPKRAQSEQAGQLTLEEAAGGA